MMIQYIACSWCHRNWTVGGKGNFNHPLSIRFVTSYVLRYESELLGGSSQQHPYLNFDSVSWKATIYNFKDLKLTQVYVTFNATTIMRICILWNLFATTASGLWFHRSYALIPIPSWRCHTARLDSMHTRSFSWIFTNCKNAKSCWRCWKITPAIRIVVLRIRFRTLDPIYIYLSLWPPLNSKQCTDCFIKV